MTPSPVRPSRPRIQPSPGTRRAIDCEAILYIHSPRGLPWPPGLTSPPPPTAGSPRLRINSGPLSLLMRVGDPRRPITRAKILGTSAPVRALDACNTMHSRLYSSTKVSHLSGRPQAVRSTMKSEQLASVLFSTKPEPKPIISQALQRIRLALGRKPSRLVRHNRWPGRRWAVGTLTLYLALIATNLLFRLQKNFHGGLRPC